MKKTPDETFMFGSRRVGSSSDGYKDPGVLRSFPQRLSTVTGADSSCCNIGRDILKQEPKPLNKPTTIHRRDFLGDPLKDDEIVHKSHPIDSLSDKEIPPNDLLDLITIEGPPDLQQSLRALCA